MIIINNVNLPLDTDFSKLITVAARELKINADSVKTAKLHRRSVDARHKFDIHFCCSILVEVNGDEQNYLSRCKNAQIYNKKEYVWKTIDVKPECRPVIVGFGPAGMFASLTLARAGLCPIVLERGNDVDTRTKDVNTFFEGGKLNTESNVQFGEGGAGTFSDGKLNTGTKDVRCRTVIESFVDFGAPERILIDAKPHIGTDILVNVVKNLRKRVIKLGGEIRFSSKLDDIIFENGKVSAVKTGDEEIKCNTVILATGHSSRDTLEMLKKNDIEMIRKPFAMGVRIEHLQSDINKAMYGKFADNKALKAADYKLAVHLKNGRGVYTFCMCPGGEVINSSSEDGGIAINGMSKSMRDGLNANSAVLVGVEPADLNGTDVLEGCYLQREIEQKAYKIANGLVPVTTVGEFVFGTPDTSGKVKPTVKPGTVNANFEQIFPKFITENLKDGIKELDKRLYGFADTAALLTAPETRSSSPVRIVRNESFESVSLSGLYPCGEGAGYAGGIVSAAVDGMRVAEAVIDETKKRLPETNDQL